MSAPPLYSVRMRASAGDAHLSGAERLIPRERIDAAVQELVRRALERDTVPDQVTVTIDAIGGTPVRSVPSLDLTALTVNDLSRCRQTAIGIGTDRSRSTP